jgi:hypothetical protein
LQTLRRHAQVYVNPLLLHQQLDVMVGFEAVAGITSGVSSDRYWGVSR